MCTNPMLYLLIIKYKRISYIMTPLAFLLAGLAALTAGAVNALAGGGTLITFPMLTAVGIPAVAANVTNTVALCPGYLGATLAQWKEIREQKQRALLFLPAAVIGGTSLSGGEGTIVGTIIGAFIMSVLTNGLRILSVPQEWQMVVTGGIVIAAVYMDILRRRQK